MANAKPYVAAACICEQVLTEKDDVSSIIRMVDIFTLQPVPGAPPDAIPVLPLTAFIAVKSGDVTGSHNVGLVLRRPNGDRAKQHDVPVVVNGGEHGANLRALLQVDVRDFGLYWLDVLWDDELLTSIPFRVRRPPEVPATATKS